MKKKPSLEIGEWKEIVALTAPHDGVKLSIDLMANADAVLLVW